MAWKHPRIGEFRRTRRDPMGHEFVVRSHNSGGRWFFGLKKICCTRTVPKLHVLALRGLLRARSRFPGIVENIENRWQRMKSLEYPNALAQQVNSPLQLSSSANNRKFLKFRISAPRHGNGYYPQLPTSGLLARNCLRVRLASG
jgi:hypothetical protein